MEFETNTNETSEDKNSNEPTTSSSASALQENISRKGTHSYYYAHGKKIDGPKWDGKEEPRLLSSTPIILSPKKITLVQAFESFSWLDEEKVVKIYIEFEKASDLPDEQISLESTAERLEFKVIAHDGQQFALVVNPLHNLIKKSSYRKKSDKFVITLTKLEEISWNQLKQNP